MRFHRGNQDSVHKVFRRGQAAEHSGESQDRAFVRIHLKTPGQGCLVQHVNVGLNVSHGQGVTRNRSTVHTHINLEIVSEYLVTASQVRGDVINIASGGILQLDKYPNSFIMAEIASDCFTVAMWFIKWLSSI